MGDSRGPIAEVHGQGRPFEGDRRPIRHRLWGNQKECPGYTINGVAIEDKPAGADYYYNLSTPPIRPLTALKAGENTFATVVAKGRMPDIYMPGVQVLIRYRTGDSATMASPTAQQPHPKLASNLVQNIQVSQETNAVNVYDFLEVTARPVPPVGGNPFTDVLVEGEFSLAQGRHTLEGGWLLRLARTAASIKFALCRPSRAITDSR